MAFAYNKQNKQAGQNNYHDARAAGLSKSDAQKLRDNCKPSYSSSSDDDNDDYFIDDDDDDIVDYDDED